MLHWSGLYGGVSFCTGYLVRGCLVMLAPPSGCPHCVVAAVWSLFGQAVRQPYYGEASLNMDAEVWSQELLFALCDPSLFVVYCYLLLVKMTFCGLSYVTSLLFIVCSLNDGNSDNIS